MGKWELVVAHAYQEPSAWIQGDGHGTYYVAAEVSRIVSTLPRYVFVGMSDTFSFVDAYYFMHINKD